MKMLSSIFERTVHAVAGYFEPISEVKLSYLSQTTHAEETENPLTDYERSIAAMHNNFPESMELIEQIGGNVEAGLISEDRAISLMGKIAVYQICEDLIQ